MNWEECARASEKLLTSPQVPSSLEIITLIKTVNPTSLTLSEKDKERGYQLKSSLQSLLLEHYGDAFHLVPHPVSPNIVLIKHRTFPSIDACHADLAALPSDIIDKMETSAPLPPRGEEPEQQRSMDHREKEITLSPVEALHKAQSLLHEYDYVAAEEMVAGLRARGTGDVEVITRAAAILLYEIGAYQRCIDTLLSQPTSVLKNRGIRQLLAVAYHHNGLFPEARTILDELHAAELGTEALTVYADIAFKDGNLSTAFDLVKIARGRGGVTLTLDSLQNEIETALAAEAEPLVEKARAALEASAYEDAKRRAREALEVYPCCHAAREVLAFIEGIDRHAEVAELWARVDAAESGGGRLALLMKLLERDKEKTGRIRELIDEEKQRQRRMLFDQHLESLRALVLDQRWPQCFDALILLSRQPEFKGRSADILSLSPFFSLLIENKQLRGTIDRSAKDQWLRFIKVKSSLAGGSADGCFEILEKAAPWFNSCREFQEDYQALLQLEQGRARQEIAALLEQSQAESRVVEVRSIFGCLRKRMSLLPFTERQELVRTMEQRLAFLTPEQDPGEPLKEYREALQTGNSEKAAYLRDEITDTAAMQAIDSEFSEAFHIPTEVLSLEITDDLPIDLTTPPPLQIRFEARDRFALGDGENSLVMIDFPKRSAFAMRSPVFRKIGCFDYTGNGTFLFVEKNDEGYGETVWRAELSVERAAFTARFDAREWFEVENGYSINGVLMSSERDTDYYICVHHDGGRSPKVMKKRLAPKGTVECFPGKKGTLTLLRLTSSPDCFLLLDEGRVRHLNRNLSLRASLKIPPKIYKIDQSRSHIYGMESCLLTKRGANLEVIKRFENGKSLGLFEPERVHGISYETNTALVVMGDGKQSFYNLSNNKFSNKIRVGRVIPHGGRWYCFDYVRQQGKLRLRDITQDIHTMLEWREFFCPNKKRKKLLKNMVWFNEGDNFLYKPETWGPAP